MWFIIYGSKDTFHLLEMETFRWEFSDRFNSVHNHIRGGGWSGGGAAEYVVVDDNLCIMFV